MTVEFKASQSYVISRYGMTEEIQFLKFMKHIHRLVNYCKNWLIKAEPNSLTWNVKRLKCLVVSWLISFYILNFMFTQVVQRH